MNKEVSLLHNDVQVRYLPKQRGSDKLFHGGDERGRVATVSAMERPMQVEVVEFANAGVQRGKHLHKSFTEQLYIFKESIEMTCRRGDSKEETETLILKEGALATIHPGTAHIFTALEPTIAISQGWGADPFEDREVVEM